MSYFEALEADQSGEKPFFKIEKDVESFESSLQVSTPPESEKLPWCVGDIVWSKIPGHPWWPSLIAHEPDTAVYFKMKGRTRYYHVQFFGTEPMRGWVTERNVLKYEGKSHFLSLRLSVHGKPHKIGNKQLPVWENAIKTADKALPLNHHERQESFNVFTFSIMETPDTGIDQGTGNVPSELEDKTSNATAGKMKGGHEDISTGSDEPPVKKTRVDHDADRLTLDNTKPDNAKPKNNSPSNSSKNTVKQTPLTTPKQMKTTPNRQVNNKVNKPVNKELAKHINNKQDKQVKNKLDKPVNNKLDKQVKNKLDKPVNNKLDKQVKNKLDKPVNNNKLDKQVMNKLDKQVKKKIKDNCIFVNHSPTSCTVQMNINPKTPENGKRKRGRPRKDLLFLVGHNKDEQAVTLAKKLKTEKIRSSANTLSNNLSSPSAENEKSDGASDTNSISSMDTESRKSLSKIKEYVCAVCEKPDNLLICEGVCNIAYHKDCLISNVLPEKFICDKCATGNQTCFVCGKTDNVINCSSQNCGKFYHLDCIKIHDPKIKDENFICPLHHCNVCGTSKSSSLKRRLTCCTRCPVAYHSSTCIVAGSLPITSGYLVCNRHFIADPKKAHHLHVNVNWCFVCSIGGTLICCESCPAAFHAECIEETGIPEGRFFCRDCKDGKEMLYGEIVWVKLGMYRWWPAQICNPNNIPTNIQRMKHQPGEFPVQFLGSHDYYWIHRGRVFSYQEGDKGSIGSGGKYLAEIFKKALVEAQEKYAEWQKAQEEKAEKDLEKLSKKPAIYKHIKINRYTTATQNVIDESEWSTCDCSINDENPCGPDSHCLNRILYVECSPLKCPAREKCQNQCFVKRQCLDCEPFRADRRGWGLKAKADAKKGQFVIEYVGELISDETCRERVRKGINDGVINYYMLTIDKDCIIDAGPMGNLSRFMNHGCDPNCETQKWTVNGEVRVGLFAKRDIKEGEEVVFDYQLDCLGNEKKKCSCGSENCSGFLGVRPKTQHALKLQEEKKKNQESKKKKKKTANKKNVDEHEDECYDCGDGGELIMCSKTGCSKCYHLSCLTIDKIPHGDWLCPWHFCDDCGKAAMLRCQECSNSFCLAHAPRQITKMADGRYLCDQHPETGLDTSDVSRNNTPTNTPSDPNVISEDPTHPGCVSTNSIDEPPNPSSVSTDPTNVPTNTTNAPINPTSVLSNSTNAPLNPASDPTNPTNTPLNPTSVLSNSTNAPINPTSDPTNPTNTPTIASSAPTIASSDPMNFTNAPLNPTSDPTNPTNTTTNASSTPTYTSTDPTNVANAPLNPTSDPTNPTSDVDNATNTPNDPSIVHDDLVKNPASVSENPPVS